MPLVDGIDATRRIREFERAQPLPPGVIQSSGRVPIFAVSAHLRRGEEQKYADAEFDGWMPKPVNMTTLRKHLAGGLDPLEKERGRYCPENFELGGWLC